MTLPSHQPNTGPTPVSGGGGGRRGSRRTSVEVMSLEEVSALANAAKLMGDHRAHALIATAYYSAARRSELAAMTLRSIQWETGKLRFMRTKPEPNLHTVDMPAAWFAIMRRYLMDRDLGSMEPLWLGKHGPLTGRGIHHIITQLAKKTGLQRAPGYSLTNPEKYKPLTNVVRPHTLRASRATHLRAAGVSVFVIADLLGHADINTTEAYTRADDGEMAGAQELVTPI